jgi:hypothetical protein
MRSLVLSATLVVAMARPAIAGFPVPDPSKCTIPASILLVGSDAATADPIGNFSVSVRDFSDHPIANSTVTIRFSVCTYAGICQYQPGISMDCPNKEVMTFTGVGGVATLSVIGSASAVDCPSDSPGCAAIYADGVFLGNVSVAALDLDGVPGLTGGDLATWLGGYFCGSSSPRLDTNGDGLITGGDLSLWLSAFFGGHSANGCAATLCK